MKNRRTKLVLAVMLIVATVTGCAHPNRKSSSPMVRIVVPQACLTKPIVMECAKSSVDMGTYEHCHIKVAFSKGCEQIDASTVGK